MGEFLNKNDIVKVKCRNRKYGLHDEWIYIIHYVKSVQIRSFFWSIFSRIQAQYREILCISPYSVRMRENTDQKKLRIWTLLTQWSFPTKISRKQLIVWCSSIFWQLTVADVKKLTELSSKLRDKIGGDITRNVLNVKTEWTPFT